MFYTEVLCFRLPAVEETILKRKKRIVAAQARQARANLHVKKVPILKLEFIVMLIYRLICSRIVYSGLCVCVF